MESILIVDDDRQVRKVLRLALARKGYAIIETADGAAAIDRFDGQGVDLVITDLLMPGVDGFETILALRARRPHLKIIAISGGSAYNDPATGLRLATMLGADVILEKPLATEELLNTVHRLLNAEIVMN